MYYDSASNWWALKLQIHTFNFKVKGFPCLIMRSDGSCAPGHTNASSSTCCASEVKQKSRGHLCCWACLDIALWRGEGLAGAAECCSAAFLFESVWSGQVGFGDMVSALDVPLEKLDSMVAASALCAGYTRRNQYLCHTSVWKDILAEWPPKFQMSF